MKQRLHVNVSTVIYSQYLPTLTHSQYDLQLSNHGHSQTCSLAADLERFSNSLLPTRLKNLCQLPKEFWCTLQGGTVLATLDWILEGKYADTEVLRQTPFSFWVPCYLHRASQRSLLDCKTSQVLSGCKCDTTGFGSKNGWSEKCRCQVTRFTLMACKSDLTYKFTVAVCCYHVGMRS